jgi:beta-1,4-mannosyltransferase
MLDSASRILKIGSWPSSTPENRFAEIVAGQLRSAGATTVDVQHPSRLRPGDIDVLQIHWADCIFWGDSTNWRSAADATSTLRSIARLKEYGVKISWLVHNLQPHDLNWTSKIIWPAYAAALARLTDGFLTLSEKTLPLVAAQFPFRPGTPSTWIPHPRYPSPGTDTDRAADRRTWSMNDTVLNLAFVGLIRDYKGVLDVANLVAKIPPGRVTLTIAGRVSNYRLGQKLQAIAHKSPAVRFHPGYLDDAQFASLVSAADYIVLPFTSSLHSGSLIHALSLGTPVLTTANPYAADVQARVGPQWVTLFEPPLSPEILLALPPAPTGLPNLDFFNPDTLGTRLLEFYASL